MTVDEEFKFAIERHDEEPPAAEKGWSVHLPHQCDRWDIAGSEYDGVSHADAVVALERFIAAANATLVRLKAREDDGEHCNCY